MEFAIVSVAFLSLLLFIFEFSYDAYCQAALNAGVVQAARLLGTGNAQNVQDSQTFIQSYLCPNLPGLISCTSNVFVRIQKVTLSTAATDDFWSHTSGALPGNGVTLDLSDYDSGNFCNTAPNEYVILTAVYVGPSFVGKLLGGLFTITYAGQLVHASISSTAFSTEYYSTAAVSGNGTVAKQCP